MKDIIEARVTQIKAQIEETTFDYDRGEAARASGQAAGGVASVIRVGGATRSNKEEERTTMPCTPRRPRSRRPPRRRVHSYAP